MIFAVGCLILGAGLDRLWSPGLNPSSVPAIAFSIELPANDSTAEEVPLAIAPDGSRIAYGAVQDGRRRLFVRLLGRDATIPVLGTVGARQPVFSPDGQEIAFAADGKLKRTTIAGGGPVVLCDLPDPKGIAWGTDDAIVFAPDASSGLFRIGRKGGAPEALTSVAGQPAGWSHRWPLLLPHNVVLFVETHGTPTEANVVAQSLETGQRETVIVDGTKPQYVAVGQVTYVNRRGEMFLAPFDSARLAVTGLTVPLPERPVITKGGDATFSVSSDGTLVFVPVNTPRRIEIVNWAALARASRE